MKSLAGLAAAFLAIGATGPAARAPKALAVTQPGLWEISGRPTADRPERMCIADVASLSQLEHRGSHCTRVVIRDEPGRAEVHYTCSGGGFGQSKIELLTPRSLRIETQGISNDAPFNYVFQARRVGDCPSH